MILSYLKTLRILTFLLAIAISIVSIAGAFFPETYERDASSMAPQGMGQDLVDLFLVVPLLLISFYYTIRRNKVWTLIYTGTLFFILYSFILYGFGLHFNRFFLLYCATLGLSLYSFILAITALRQQEVDTWFQNAPVKLVSGYIFLVALVFYTLWLKSIIPAVVNNEVPADVADYDLLVNPVHVIDLVFALPALIIGSILIWKKQGLGYIICSIALIFMILLTIALAAMVVMVVVRNISEEFTVAIIFGILTLFSLIITSLLFRKISS